MSAFALCVLFSGGWLLGAVFSFSVAKRHFARMLGTHVRAAVKGTLAGAREPEIDDLPPEEHNPPGWVPPEPTRCVEISNGRGAVLALKVRGHAFRIVSFTRPPMYASLDPAKEPETIDLWLSTDALVKALSLPPPN